MEKQKPDWTKYALIFITALLCPLLGLLFLGVFLYDEVER